MLDPGAGLLGLLLGFSGLEFGVWSLEFAFVISYPSRMLLITIPHITLNTGLLLVTFSDFPLSPNRRPTPTTSTNHAGVGNDSCSLYLGPGAICGTNGSFL